MTYRSSSGRQFVVVATGGGEDASLVAFALGAGKLLTWRTTIDRGTHIRSGGFDFRRRARSDRRRRLRRRGHRPRRRPARNSAATTGPDGRFTIETPETGDVTDRRPRRRLRREDAEGVAPPDGRSTSSSTPATLLETVTVTPTRTEQRLGDVPASVSVVTSEAIEASPALVADDVLRQVPTLQPVPPHQQPRRRSRPRRACRCAASGRAARAARSCCSTASRSTIRSAAGSTGRACRSSASIASRSPRTRRRACTATIAMGGVINIVTSRPTRRTLELKPQYGNHDSPKFDFFASDQWNKVRRAVEGSFFNTDGFPDRRGDRARADRQQRQRRLQEHHRQGRVHAVRSRSARSSAPATSPRTGTTARSANSTTRGGRRVNGGVRARLPDDSDLQARVFVDVAARALQLPRGDQRRPRRATSSAWRPTSTCRPTASAAWRSGRRRSARKQRLQRRRRLALGRRRQPGGRATSPAGARRRSSGR